MVETRIMQHDSALVAIAIGTNRAVDPRPSVCKQSVLLIPSCMNVHYPHGSILLFTSLQSGSAPLPPCIHPLPVFTDVLLFTPRVTRCVTVPPLHGCYSIFDPLPYWRCVTSNDIFMHMKMSFEVMCDSENSLTLF